MTAKITGHEASSIPRYDSYSMASRKARRGSPAPAMVSKPVSAPLVSVSGHEDPGNPCIRDFGTGRRVGRSGKPAQTMISSGGATSTPLVGQAMKGDGAYARMLERVLPRAAPPTKAMTLAEFFCCAGGIGLGFRSAGFRLAFANDISKRAAESYAKNLGHAPLVRDIREVGPGDYGPPRAVDVVTGGFPCVTFSMAGKRAGVVDDLNGKLYMELCRVITDLQPRYFVAENVKGMLSANGGKAVKIVLAEFLRLGYRTAFELVNMAEHGVPQTRERVIFVGVRVDQWRGSFSFPKRTHRLRDDKGASRLLPLAVSLAEAIGDLPAPGERLLGVEKHAGDFDKGGKVFRPAREPAGTVDSSQGRMAQRVRVVGAMHGDTAYREAAKKRGEGKSVSTWKSAKPTTARDPSPVTTSTHPPHVMIGGHERNDAPVSDAHQMSKRFAARRDPAPTIVSEAANVQPFIRARPSTDGFDEDGLPIDRSHEPNDDMRGAAFGTTSRSAKRGKPAPTIMSGSGGAVRMAQPIVDGVRRMTVRECARVQSFPDWYEFAGGQSDGYTVIGNAVPPLYARRLALAIADYDRRRIIAR